MSTCIRLTAKLAGPLTEHKVKHYVGLPPELTEGRDHRELLPVAASVAIVEKPDGVFLYRFAEDGQEVGDTWHRNVGEAKEQAQYEFGNLLTDWIPVPREVKDEDLASFGLNARYPGKAT